MDDCKVEVQEKRTDTQAAVEVLREALTGTASKSKNTLIKEAIRILEP